MKITRSNALSLLLGFQFMTAFAAGHFFAKLGIRGLFLLLPFMVLHAGAFYQIRERITRAYDRAREASFITRSSVLTQASVEDAVVWAVTRGMTLKEIRVSPRVLSDYNKLAFGKERIILAGAPRQGAAAHYQWVPSGCVELKGDDTLTNDQVVFTLLADKLPTQRG